MTGSPYGVTPGGSWQPPPPSPPFGSPPASKQSRTLLILSLAIAVLAVAVAIGSWFRPVDHAPPSAATDTPEQYSPDSVAAAKDAICGAYQKTDKAITTAGGQTSDDPNVRYIIAVNARVTILANASYIRQALAENPSLPPDVARIFLDMASAYDEILMGQLSDAPSESFRDVNAKLDAADAEAVEACK